MPRIRSEETELAQLTVTGEGVGLAYQQRTTSLETDQMALVGDVSAGGVDVKMALASHDTGSVTRTLSELRVTDLRSELDQRGLDKTGLKAVLIERLSHALRDEGENPETYHFTVQVEPASATPASTKDVVNTDAEDSGGQSAKKAENTRKTWPDEEPIAGWVMCNGCEMWIQLEHTPFATTEEAEAAQTYLCKHCERFRLLKEEFLMMTREIDKGWRLALNNIATRLTEPIDNTAKERHALRKELAEERYWRTALRVKVDELRKVSLEAGSEAADQTLARDSAAEEDNARRKSGGATAVDNVEGRPMSDLNPDKRDKVSESIQKTTTPPVQEVTTPGGSPAATPPEQEHQKDVTGARRKNRHVFIYGDESASRMKHAVLRTVNWNKQVHYRVRDGASIQEISAQVDSATDIWGIPEAMVVLHAGLINLQKGEAPEETLLFFRATSSGLERDMADRQTYYADNGSPREGAPSDGKETATSQAQSTPTRPKAVRVHTERRRRRRTRVTSTNIGFLNMHGARKPSKWEELYGVLDSEAIELYAVAETHLRELEEPPVNPLWQWAGNNREGEARKGVRRKGWWDEEVRKALDERKAANRLHRKAVKTLSASDALQAWQEYLTCKHAMQTIVQSKIAEHNSRQLQSFTADGRNGARKFWTYVSSLDGKAKVPQIRHEDTGQPVSDMGRHLADHMRKLYDVGSGEQEIDSVEYHPINEYRLSNNVKWEVTHCANIRLSSGRRLALAVSMNGIALGVFVATLSAAAAQVHKATDKPSLPALSRALWMAR
ncbi:hypothetical protein HPB52_023621 [Rhipicephalus sanguineus]|uniref:SAP domain-containing protein n=1 Tax=Rhipicephalus sanguineus TaxID=34632 RepID=A0A9D4SV20_RHISA|nr:hypothetical protein HPB52_023621 [Rhipicephalus sanguineus]